MKTLSTCLLFLMFASSAYAEIYRIQNKDGSVTFTDRPVSGKKDVIHLPKTVVIKDNFVRPQSSNTDTTEKLGKFSVKIKEPLAYKQFNIAFPKNSASVRNNMGNIELRLSISPALQTQFGHQIKIELDGKMQPSSWKTNSILFTGVDRGTHVFRAHIVDQSGKRLKSSKRIEFHLLRFSRLFKPSK